MIFLAIGVATLTGTALAADVAGEQHAAQTALSQTNDSFNVSNLSVEDGESVTVTADITNPGAEPAIQPVELRVDGELIEYRPWALNPGETEQIRFDVESDQVSEDSIISVQTRTHGEVAIFGEAISPEASITFEDQTSDGTSVTIADISNDETPYYGAVWTVNNETGEPETLLGAAQVTENETSNLTVDFEEPIEENQTLVAAVHPDEDGDAETIDPVADEILASDTANVTVEAVEQPPEASVTFEDQTSDGTTVTIADISNDETPYYGAVWTVNNETGEPETLLGAAQVSDNETSNLTVSFEEPIEENQTLVAAVHPDEDGNASTVDPITDEILASDTANVTVEMVEQPPEASITFEDQTSDGTTVTIANISNDETPYYGAVWTVNNETGEPETLLGAAQVTENETSDLTVSFEEPIEENQTLIAAVHPDEDGNASTVDPITDEILASDTANVTVEAIEQPPEASVTFEDQTSDGTSVTIANASNDEVPYYGAIWTVNNETGEPETLLGAAQVTENETSDLTVSFEEPIEENQTLIAAVHPDEDGDAETIDPVADEILASDTANVTVEMVEQPPEASVTFEDQTSDGTSVTIADISNDETPYYGAVWTVNNETGEPETLLGAAQVSDNETSDLTVSFEEPIEENQTLVAAVHPDEDGNASTVDPITEAILASDTANVTVEAVEQPPEASVTFEDQTSDGSTVAVANALYEQPPFYVAVYDTNASGDMAMIGLRQVVEPESSELAVTLDEPLDETEALVVGLHPDADGEAGTTDPVTDSYLAIDMADVAVDLDGANATSAIEAVL
ncbi:S-layer-forming halobacterial major cell surfaceglycoprotein [Halapricum desulfuricans]|uniref:S-layer-forming halobacterial major cell surfaceglycoprotein n=1 Tax=Halapricum desulfuricans TaxID=2841257 RepID=A0A897N3K5_9EURY|nr:S-layer-forming halobacterial major cell surfaceglycoprotein [Halapricum desulfuricans]